ncbi:MAG: primosomal protein N' [Verrucomicrobiae bacterium]|nr:primosomal protein N' [Verrucomicrobiae bacterium]
MADFLLLFAPPPCYPWGPMVARVTLEIALQKEFDYLVPADMEPLVAVGTRVKVPFAGREVLGCVTALLERSPHPQLKSIIKIIGRPGLVTPKVLALARWIADYYCCAPEVALRSVLPQAVRREKEGWRERLFVRVAPRVGEMPELTRRQEEVWRVVEEMRGLPLKQLVELTGATPQTIRRLEDKGLILISPEVDERDPYAAELILPTQPLPLNAEQARALQAITGAMGTPGQAAPPRPAVFLLHGVTGSGKTEVYLQAIAHALSLGRGAIVLVPEISLTPQTVECFKARFSSGPLQTLVAVLHSHLSEGERHDEWHKIRQGRARIVIGARSAIFAPVEPLGLIIVDEEHEHSYKQEEAPRYHARDVAVVRGTRENAVVVLGSATPSMESYYNARRGKYTLLELPHRADHKKMPVVRVVDMRAEARRERGQPPVFAQPLREAILRRLERREQVILFLNRRGYATALECPLCGYVARCPHCSVALTYHRPQVRLRCHICNYDAEAPAACPNPPCRNPGIRYAGLGTQKVEHVLTRLFPTARICRMDSDVLQRKEDYRRILGDFKAGKVDILVGTQMIAKGLHFENVTLVGVIYADLSLHLPDFRAGERTFQLLTQVAGRAGRGEVEGEVFVQSFTPFHPAIQYARRHDFAAFYEQELEFRQQLHYPPFSRLARLLFRGRNEEKVAFFAGHCRKQMEALAKDLPDLQIAGPAPAPLARAETFYRHHLTLRTRHMTKLSAALAALLPKLALPEDVLMAVDVDPVALL